LILCCEPTISGYTMAFEDINPVETEQKTSEISKRIVMLIAAMSSFLTPFTASSVNIALPSINRELVMSAVSLSWVATAYLLAAAMFLVPLGRVADIKGRKRVFLYGMTIDALASILCTMPKSSAWLIAFRAMQGLGGAMIFGTGVAILTSVFPPRERGRALGINVAAVYTGLSAGPLVGGFLTEHLGWRSIFFLNALLGVVVVITVLWKLKAEWVGAKGEKFDMTGAIIYTLSLVAVMSGFSELPSALGFVLLVMGTIGLGAFSIWEGRVKYPIFNINLFKYNRVFRFSNLAALANYSSTFAVAFLLSLYLQYIKDFTAEHAGLILVTQPIVMIICSPIAGSLSDRIEPGVIASIGMSLTTLALVLLTFLNSASSLFFIMASLIVLGMGFGFFSSPNTNAVMSSVEKRFYGVASGVLGTMRLTGQMFSMGVSLLLFALYIGGKEIAPEYYPVFLKCMKMAFIISACLCFLGIFASIARGRTRGPVF
jgi:EmrB/QacA subfamily drug resistance transporter